MRSFILISVLIAGSACCAPSLAAQRTAKPPQAEADNPHANGKVICRIQQPCRPVRPGCHLAQMGIYVEEVCR